MLVLNLEKLDKSDKDLFFWYLCVILASQKLGLFFQSRACIWVFLMESTWFLHSYIQSFLTINNLWCGNRK